jgi:hypothetical protein
MECLTRHHQTLNHQYLVGDGQENTKKQKNKNIIARMSHQEFL